MSSYLNRFYVITKNFLYLIENNVRFEELMYTDSGSPFKFLIRYNNFCYTNQFAVRLLLGF